MNEGLDLAKTLQILFVGSLHNSNPVKWDQGLQPQKHTLLFAKVLRLELDHYLLEEISNQFVVLKSKESISDGAVLSVWENPIKSVSVIRSKGLGEDRAERLGQLNILGTYWGKFRLKIIIILQ